MYTTNGLYQIDADTLDKALSALTSTANHHTQAAQLLRAIKARSGCVGRIFNRACIPAIQSALPGYRVSYIIRDGLKRRPREVVICRLDKDGRLMCGASNHWYFDLATADRPRLEASRLDEQISNHVSEAARYASIAADLPAQVAAYNAAAAYLQPIKRDIDQAMLYAGI